MGDLAARGFTAEADRRVSQGILRMASTDGISREQRRADGSGGWPKALATIRQSS
jgi:hypothetical protein